MDRYRIMLANDHSMVRRGIRELLHELIDIEVIGEARDGLELLELLKNGSPKPELIILDIGMPHMMGTEAADKIKERFKDIMTTPPTAITTPAPALLSTVPSLITVPAVAENPIAE